MRTRSLCLLLPLMLAGCAVGPKYQRPAVAIPARFPGAAASSTSLADKNWAGLFQDDTLNLLIAEALEKNLDLGIASQRVLEARELYRITGATEYPYLGAQGQFAASRSSSVGAQTLIRPGADTGVSYTQAGAGLSWELDFWGRVRRLRESARAQYLATEEARNAVVVSLVSDVAGGYFSLRERDLELEIARGTRDIAENNLKLVKLRHQQGAASGLEERQAEQLLYTAAAQIARVEREIAQAENALNLLLGRAPGPITRGKAVDDFGLPAQVPPGLPSALLERRPDIRRAEQALIAANAQIGVAKAYYFPQISLTGFLGGQSRALTGLLTAPARLASVTPAAVLPIFDAGRVRAGVRYSEAQKTEMVIAYQRAVFNALREVSDALVRYDRTREQRAQQDRLVNAVQESVRLSKLRYQGGMDSYLQVLDAERNLFSGRLTLAQLRLQELLSYIDLYRALGGGWQ
ncbi:MAG: efflux transporter outer membrane subunit [Bryobacteraceae bacterium]